MLFSLVSVSTDVVAEVDHEFQALDVTVVLDASVVTDLHVAFRNAWREPLP